MRRKNDENALRLFQTFGLILLAIVIPGTLGMNVPYMPWWFGWAIGAAWGGVSISVMRYWYNEGYEEGLEDLDLGDDDEEEPDIPSDGKAHYY